ncbi:MAG TPA: hypothetical protein VFV73_16390 [Streptosporangiaceae bacterium]|nr:hypothetical protein [Streptosporangiaceae bacterium]
MPKGMSMTRAPCVTAYRIPAAAVATDRGPEPPTVTGRILARGAMPTVPGPGPASIPWPAIITAIAVPWPSSPTWMSVSPLRGVPVRPALVRLMPGRTTPRRSGRLAWTPLSTSATVIPAPWDSGHTFRCTCQAASHHSPGPGASRALVPAGRVPLASEGPAVSGRAHSASRPTVRTDSRLRTPVDTDGRIAPAHRPRAG